MIQQLLEVGKVLDIVQVYVLDLTVLRRNDLAVFQELLLVDLQNLALLRQNYLYYLILRRAGIFSSLSLWCGHHSILWIIRWYLMQVLLCCLLLDVLHEEALAEIWPLWRVDLAQVMLIFFWLMTHEEVSIFIAFDHDSAICLRHSYELWMPRAYLELFAESWEILNGSRDGRILVDVFILASIGLEIVEIDVLLHIFLDVVPIRLLNWVIDTERRLKLGHLLWANIHLVLVFRSFEYLIRWIPSHISVTTLHQLVLRRLVHFGRRIKLQFKITLSIRMLVVDISTHGILVGLLSSVIKLLVVLGHLPKLELRQLLIE